MQLDDFRIIESHDCESTLSAGYWAAVWWVIWCCSWYHCFSVRVWYISRFRFISNMHQKSSFMVYKGYSRFFFLLLYLCLTQWKCWPSRTDSRWEQKSGADINRFHDLFLHIRFVTVPPSQFKVSLIWSYELWPILNLGIRSFQENLEPFLQWYLCQYLLPCTVSYGALLVRVRNLTSFRCTYPLHRL